MLTHIGTNTIETERLTLRRFEYSDNEAMLKYWIADEKIQSLYSEPVYSTKEAVKELLDKYISSYERNDYYRWAIIEKNSGECIGQIAYFLVDSKNHFAEIEYCIGSNFQCKGYATEATKAIISYGFDRINLHKDKPVYITLKLEPSEGDFLRNQYEDIIPGYYRWAIIEKNSGECIGQIAYFLVDSKNHFAEIEYCIGSNFQCKGYATEATKAIISYGFDRINLHKDKPVYITLKLEPSEGDFLRNQYEDIIPGYYMNKLHWNSIKADGEVPDDLVKDILEKSYELVLGGFSKKKQKELLGQEEAGF